MRRLLACVAIVSVIGAFGCRKTDSKAAVEAAVQNHLNHNSHLMLNSFTTHFETVTVKGDTAQALVKYESKNVPNLAVQVSYGLKKVNGGWQVVSSSSAGGQMTNPANPHQGVTLDQTPPPGSQPPAPVPSH
ncbi:MAG TPA: hypothetical protein VGY31_06770 [Terriglobia bacterium]|nr:hypothetical protein [Terriglobia bacterium]